MRTTMIMVALAVATLGAGSVLAGSIEMFDEGVSGWEAYDMVNQKTARSLSFEDGALRLRYGSQSMPVPPETHVVRADASASGGVFTGDYIAGDIAAVCFRIKPVDGMSVELLLQNDENRRRWRSAIGGLTPNEWNRVRVSLAPETLDPVNSDAGQYQEDLGGISWIGIQVVRADDTSEQICYIDDVRTETPEDVYMADVEGSLAVGGWRVEFLPDADCDHDGVRNKDEWIAGTDLEDGNDFLAITDVHRNEQGTLLRWKTKPGRLYQVLRSTAPGAPSTPVSQVITASATEEEFLDEEPPEGNACYYKVAVRQP